MTDKETPANLSDLSDPIAIGRSAEIYPWTRGKVAKLFFKTIGLQDIENEYKNTCEAVRQNVCGMACHGKVMLQGRSGIVLDRVDGISLTKQPEKNPICFFSLSKTLACLHIELHKSQTQNLREIREFAAGMLDAPPFGFLTLEEKKKAKTFISKLPEGSCILHMDFHPENVLVSKKSLVIIDWMTAARGNPAADVASSFFLMHDAELFPGLSMPKRVFYGIVRRFILHKYLKHYLKRSAMTMEDIMAWRLPILILRLGLWNIDSERNRLRNEILRLFSISCG